MSAKAIHTNYVSFDSMTKLTKELCLDFWWLELKDKIESTYLSSFYDLAYGEYCDLLNPSIPQTTNIIDPDVQSFVDSFKDFTKCLLIRTNLIFSIQYISPDYSAAEDDIFGFSFSVSNVYTKTPAGLTYTQYWQDVNYVSYS